jgi:predicted esterase
MPGWFDLYDWPIAVGVTDDREQKLRAVQQVKDVVQTLQAESGGKPLDKVVIGGFSQGGAIALLAAFYPDKKDEPPVLANVLKGCVSLSGWLTLLDDLHPLDAATTAQVPLFWGHGRFDDKVLFEHQLHGVSKLRELGLQTIEDHVYPIGHSSNEEEIRHLADFLDRVFFGADDAAAAAADNDKKKGEL